MACWIGLAAAMLSASCGCNSGAEEKAAAEELKAMGALVVNSTEGYPTSLALFTGKDVDVAAALPLATKLVRLDSLNASGTDITDEQLEMVAQISSLGDLQLQDTAITDKGVQTISRLSNLTSLYLSGSKVTSACLADVAKLKKLSTLGINNTAISGGYEPLVGLEGLTLLVAVHLTITEADAEVLARIPNLRRIDLTDAEVSDAALAILRAGIDQIGGR
jgi:Leucine-rich repeat (LRR) protein